jgi:hypothetical protein
MNARFGRQGSGRGVPGFLPFIFIIGLVVIVVAIVATRAGAGAGQTPTFSCSPAGSKIVTPSQTTDLTVTPTPVMKVSALQTKTAEGDSYYFTGSGFTPSYTVTLHVRGPDYLELYPLKLNTDLQGNFSYAPGISIFGKQGLYYYWVVDDATNKSSDTYPVYISSVNPQWQVPFDVSGTYIPSEYGPRYLLVLSRDGTFYLDYYGEVIRGNWVLTDQGTLLMDSPRLAYSSKPVKFYVAVMQGKTIIAGYYKGQELGLIKQ